MIHLMFNLIWQKIKKNYLFLIFLILGIAFRSYDWRAYHLGFDQVQILSNAEKILSGKLTLIGPRTGPADTFTGPLIYYLAVPLIAIFGNIKTAVLLPIILSTLTALTLYCLNNYYVKKKTALIVIIIWSISPLLILLDRVFWNPNLSLIAFSLVFWPLFFAKKIKRRDLYLIALGSFLSYQAHFSAFLLPVLVFLISLIYRRPKKIFLASLAGLIISLLPTLVFDLRHGFLNSKGIWHLLNGEASGLTIALFLQNLYQNLLNTFELYSRLLFHAKNSITRSLIGLTFLLVSFFLQKNKKHFIKILIWPLLVAILMSLYKGSVPEYYFLISLPALFYLLASSLKKINKFLFFFLIIILIFNSSQFLKKTTKNQNEELSLGNSLAIKNEILSIRKEKDLKEIVYLLPHASDFGLKYLLESLSLKDSGTTIKIVYPANENPGVVAQYGRIGLLVED